MSLFYVFYLFISACIAFKRPFTPEDLVQFHRLGDIAPRQDGFGALFTSSFYEIDTDKVNTKLSFVVFKTCQVYDLAVNVGSNPFWLSDEHFGVVRLVNGTGQVFWSKIDVNNPSLLSFKQLTWFPVSVSNVKFNAQSSLLAFTASVYKDGDLYNAANKKVFHSGTVYDKLFVRHWDSYVNPEKFNQLFTLKLRIERDDIKVDGTPFNLLKGTELETPIPPDYDSNDYTFSPNGREIAFSSRVPSRSMAWNTNTDIYIVPTDGSSSPESVSAFNLGYDKHPKYSLDGKNLSWLQMQTPQYEADKNNVAIYSRGATISLSFLTKEWDRSPESLTWTGDEIIITAQEHGRMKIFSVSLNGLVRPLYEIGYSEHVVFVENVGLVFSKSTLSDPSDIFTFDLATHQLLQQTHLNKDLIKEVNISDREEFWFQGSQSQVHGFLMKPPGFDPNNVYPLAFLIHGGPESAWHDNWGLRWNLQVFAGAGYVVVSINPTGSTGYGAEFTKAIINNWGSYPYQDLMKGLDYVLDTYSYIDSERVAGLGASYGGYMINWINGHTDKFACLVNHDGIFDTISDYYNSDELFFPEIEFGGVPFSKSRTSYEKFNPSRFVSNWKTPTLVIHSEKDYRLPITEGLSTFTALQRRDIPSRFLYFPDENHWVLKHANSLLWNQQVLKWINEWTFHNGSLPSLVIQE